MHATNHLPRLGSNETPLAVFVLADEINAFFSSFFNEKDPASGTSLSQCAFKHLIDNMINACNEVECAIDRLPVKSNSGPDGISTKLLKLSKTLYSLLLGKLFQQSLSTGDLPKYWKMAHTVPVFKTGVKDSCDNYKQIFLISIACRLLEHTI